MDKELFTKRIREKVVLTELLYLYCKRKHGKKIGLCPECSALEVYVKKHSDQCPFGKKKPFCSNCRESCYIPEMQEKLIDVIEFAGPRQIVYHPFETIRFLTETKIENMRFKRKDRA